jgi:hypothetical protein
VSQPAEALKHDPDEFGGVQYRLLSSEEIPERMCAAQFCGLNGFAQLPILGEEGQWRVVCRIHAFRASKMIGDALYNPAVIEEAERIAHRNGIPLQLGHKPEPKFVQPREFRCDGCGGRMNVDTIGIYAGRRWTHTCP